MCGEEGTDLEQGTQVDGPIPAAVSIQDVVTAAEFLAGEPEARRNAAGFIGFGQTRRGDRVLIAYDSHYDSEVPQAIASALRRRGASVDLLCLDAGPDPTFTFTDEPDTVMRREPWSKHPRRWEGVPWIESLAERNSYDLLIHGKGGIVPQTPYRYEGLPWLQREQFVSAATTYPRSLSVLINEKVWRQFTTSGKGGRVRLTDPEGTNISYTLFPEYFDGTRAGYGETPAWGHLFAHGPTPILPDEDAEGVVMGTTSHFNRPFPPITLDLEKGKVAAIRGGGRYGDVWKDLDEESRGTQYPCFPRKGLFWLWEAAIGTNPKIVRPASVHKHSSGGTEWERRRSGIVHLGFGTRWRGQEEVWAGERGLLYGHLHVHLLFPTLVIEGNGGAEQVVINAGRLSVLDDPAVRLEASKYGDPDELLSEDWIPQIPGVSLDGSYAEFSANPAAWIYKNIVEAV